MSENTQPEPDADRVCVESLKLAAWLRLNGAQLLSRTVRPDGYIVYNFELTDQIHSLMGKWLEKSEYEIALSRFASLVSYEIRAAIKLRRSLGLPLRLRGLDLREHRS